MIAWIATVATALADVSNLANPTPIDSSSDASSDRWMIVIALGQFLVGFLQWLTYVRQANIMKRQTDIAEAQRTITDKALVATEKAATAAATSSNAYQTSERAWVSWKTAFSVEENAESMRFAIEWVNGGKTPALNLEIRTAWEVTETNDPPIFNVHGTAAFASGTLLPNIPTFSSGLVVPLDRAHAVMRGQRRLFLYGRAGYNLVFGEAQRKVTEVCLLCAFERAEQVVGTQVARLIWAVYPVGTQNSAT
jgi:hypothetical protein